MHERRFNREIEKLREPARVARMEVDRVVALALGDAEEIQSVLDVGTGTGLFAQAFAKKRIQVAGLDANPEMLPVAAGYVPSGVFKTGIAEALPYGDGEFDLVFMGLVLHETDDRLKAFQEAYRVTAKRLAILEWPYIKQEFGPGFNERIPAEQIAELAQQAGFTPPVEHRLKYLTLYVFEH
jgi:ubiquinone/menaquinone biosynthesis C-methylase UbiE